jgi:hypothetical protein
VTALVAAAFYTSCVVFLAAVAVLLVAPLITDRAEAREARALTRKVKR